MAAVRASTPVRPRAGSQPSEACALDPWTLQQQLSEVSDPVLQRQVLAPGVAAVKAEEHASDGEHPPLTAAAEQ